MVRFVRDIEIPMGLMHWPAVSGRLWSEGRNYKDYNKSN